MRRVGATVIKNAVANVVRGGASAIVAVVLPHFLTHDLSVSRFSSWVLMLQIAAYSNYLDFGIQTAVARYVAQATESGDQQQRDEVINTAFFLLLIAAGIALCASSLIAWNIPHLFRSAPKGLLDELRGGVLVLSLSAAALLPLSTFTGILVGLHSNEYPAIAIGGSRIVGAAAVLVVVHFTTSLIWLALCVGGFNLVGGVLQYRFSRKLMPDMRLSSVVVSRTMSRVLVRYCSGLTAFNLGMLLVSGLDLTIVGLFSFGDTGYYAVATTAITMLVGITNAIYSALMTPLAVLQQRGDRLRFRKLVLESTKLGSYSAIAMAIILTLAGNRILTIWVGGQYAAKAFPILEVLVWAQVLRLTASAYSVALVATAQQNYGIAAALAEGFVNLLASVLGARFFGPIGVAWGTLLGATCGVFWLTLNVMPRVTEVAVDARAFCREALLRPLFCYIPIIAYVAFEMRLQLFVSKVVLAGAAVLLTSLLLFRFGQIPRFSP